jgi:hypothetical protein
MAGSIFLFPSVGEILSVIDVNMSRPSPRRHHGSERAVALGRTQLEHRTTIRRRVTIVRGAVVIASVATVLAGCQSRHERQPRDLAQSEITFRSSDANLSALFDWAQEQALAYAFAGDPVGPWYEAALPGREAFCMRDVSHQALGAHFLGLADYTQNMLRKFAVSMTEPRDWCSYWEIDRRGDPAAVDYDDDGSFWYNLPANFDVVDCAYRMYQWSGDHTYVDDPVFLDFYRRTVNDYVTRWGLGLDEIMQRRRIMNVRDTTGAPTRLQLARGIPGYDEGDPGYVVALDLIVAMEAGYRAYSRIMTVHGDRAEAEEFLHKADEVRSFIDATWWDEQNRRFFTHVSSDYELSYSGLDYSIPYWNGTGDEMKMRAVVDALAAAVADIPSSRVEALSHLAEVFYRYGEHQVAYDVLMRLMHSSRREYPEVSYTAVAAVISGLMGIELQVSPAEPALSADGEVDEYLTTFPRLTGQTTWAEVTHVPIRRHYVSVRHDGLTRTTVTNESDTSFTWKAEFPGTFHALLVNDEPVAANREKRFAVGEQLSWVRVTLAPGASVTVAVPE